MFSLKLISSLLKKALDDSITKTLVGGIILNKESKVLIVKRAATEDFLPDILEFPSGHIDNNETMIKALKREIKEETGYKNISVEKYLNSFDYYSKSKKKARQFNFLIKLNSFKEPVLNPKEHQEYFWLNYEEAQLLGADKYILDCIKIVSEDNKRI